MANDGDSTALDVARPVGETRGALMGQKDPWSGLDILTLGETLYKSGYFLDVKGASQAIVKILYGKELGVGPISAMSSIHVIENKPSMSATLMATLIKRSGQYDYHVTRLDDGGCAVEYRQKIDGEWVSIGVSEFTAEDAHEAQLMERGQKMYKKFPRNMFFARAMSNGFKWYTPHLGGGAMVYVPEETPLLETSARERAQQGERVVVHPDSLTPDKVINGTATGQDDAPAGSTAPQREEAAARTDNRPTPDPRLPERGPANPKVPPEGQPTLNLSNF